MAISPVLGSSTIVIFPVVLALSSFHVVCVFNSLRSVTIRTLNVQRFWLAIRNGLELSCLQAIGQASCNPDCRREEPILDAKATVGKNSTLLDLEKLLPPRAVSKEERIIHSGNVSGDRGVVIFEQPGETSRATNTGQLELW